MLRIQEISGVNREDIPNYDESIATDCEIDKFIPFMKSITIYTREKFECPYDRGNWIIELGFVDGNIFMIKLPYEMSDDSILRYAKPLTDAFKAKKSNIKNSMN